MRVTIAAMLLVPGCYLAHERPVDAAAERGRFDTGLLFACGGLLHEASATSCETFLFTPEMGTSSCVTAAGETVSGPTFVLLAPRDASFSVRVIAPGGEVIQLAAANALDDCGRCELADLSGTGQVIEPFAHVDGPVRFVVTGVPGDVPYSATVCP